MCGHTTYSKGALPVELPKLATVVARTSAARTLRLSPIAGLPHQPPAGRRALIRMFAYRALPLGVSARGGQQRLMQPQSKFSRTYRFITAPSGPCGRIRNGSRVPMKNHTFAVGIEPTTFPLQGRSPAELCDLKLPYFRSGPAHRVYALNRTTSLCPFGRIGGGTSLSNGAARAGRPQSQSVKVGPTPCVMTFRPRRFIPTFSAYPRAINPYSRLLSVPLRANL